MTTKVPASMTVEGVTAASVAAAALAASNAQTTANTALANAALKLSGDVVQVQHFQTGAVATGTTTVPWDDTIPQITEGIEFMTLAITPTSASNILLIEVLAEVSSGAAPTTLLTLLFQDATANALAATGHTVRDINDPVMVSLRHKMTAGTTSTTTFRVRIGASAAGTLTFNGQGGARRLGGALASSITITEFKA